MGAEIIFLAVAFLSHSIILLALLWIMILIQKFDYNWPGLIGSAFLAGGLDLIPHFGHALAIPVLYICIWKLTNTNIFPDAAFTVVISYALMFCVNLFIIGALMGPLRPPGGTADEAENVTQEIAAPAQSTRPPPSKLSKPADGIAGLIQVKGIVKNGRVSTATLQCGAKTYTVALGEAVSISTDEGLVTVRFLEAGENWVTLGIHGERVKYSLK